jgi:hypothetical protein
MIRCIALIDAWSAGLALVLLMAGTVSFASDDKAPAATLSTSELRKKLLESLERIDSLRVTYRSSDYDTKRFPPGTYLHRIVAAKAPYSLYHVSAHGHGQLSWEDDFYQQRAYITRDHLYNEFPVNRSFFDHEMKPDDGLPGSLPGEFFFLATGIWPMKARKPPRPDAHPYMLNEVAVCEEFSVRAARELVGGRWCHVLERSGFDRLWIDVDRGCALMARETHSSSNGALVQRIELSDYKEIGPQIWLPGRIRNIQYDWLCPDESGRNRVVKDTIHLVVDIQVNCIEDETFRFKPRPGALFNDRVTVPRQVEGDGVDHLDYLAAWVKRNLQLPDRNPVIDVRFFMLSPAVIIIAIYESMLRFRRLLGRR